MEQDYSVREIDARFKNTEQLFQVLHDQQMETLTRIEAQTTRTNGRVTKLEATQDQHERENAEWRGRVNGMISTLKWIIGVVVVPLIASLILILWK